MTHYVPLNHVNYPTILETGDNIEISLYNSADIPLQTHKQFLKQAWNVQLAPTGAEEQRCIVFESLVD